MQSLRQAISDIVNDLKSYNLDDRFSYRFIASKLKGRIETFLKQDSLDRTIFNINEIWKPLFCIELEEASYNSCSQYYEFCDILNKSKNKIPEVYTTKYGNLIKILNLNNSIEFKLIKPFQYKDEKEREYVNKKIKYFWIEDNYLYIPDVDIEEVKAYGLFKDSQEADLFNKIIDCCFLPLDSLLLVPDYIIDISKKDVVNELSQINKKIIEDTNPNLNQLQKN